MIPQTNTKPHMSTMEASLVRSGAQVTVASSRKKVLILMIAVMLIMTLAITGFLIYKTVQYLTTLSKERQGTTTITTAQPLTSLALTEADSSMPTLIDTEVTTTGNVATYYPLSSTLSAVTVTSSPPEIPTSISTEQTASERKYTSALLAFSSTSYVASSSPTHMHTAMSTQRTTTEALVTCPPQSHSTNATDGFPKDCSEITFGAGQNRPDAIYPYGLANKSVLVNCACTSDGIWTVIQKRFDGSVDFYRNWTDYKEGFGDVSGEFWLGNDVIHQLTTSANYTLKIVLTDWDNVTKYTIYNSFNIANEADGYRLTVGEWSGNAGNSMNVHNGKMFTTRDKDNDLYIGNCADFSIGAWWYQSCCTANLNGFYYSGPNAPESKGIVWASWHGVSYSLKATSMMIIKN